MTKENQTSNYVVPKKGIRDRYKAETEAVKGGTQVTIYKDTHYDILAADASYEVMMTDRWVEVGSYLRNYPSLLKTFEPFQQLQDGIWHDYALVSSDYAQVEVMDLESGLIVFTETNGEGFCPAEFFVPDWWDHYDESFLSEDIKGEFDDEYKHLTGHFAVYAGCYWGDDTSWKIQYIDLSKMSEGIIAVDNRFGYVSLPENLDIHESVIYDPVEDYFTVSLPIQFKRNGQARHQAYFSQSINWEKTEDKK